MPAEGEKLCRWIKRSSQYPAYFCSKDPKHWEFSSKTWQICKYAYIFSVQSSKLKRIPEELIILCLFYLRKRVIIGRQ
jgi:hypothetical protein